MGGMQYYSVAGRQVGSHHLAVGWLSILFGGIYVAASGGSSAKKPVSPPINASSSDEADFIKNFLEQADNSKKSASH